MEDDGAWEITFEWQWFKVHQGPIWMRPILLYLLSRTPSTHRGCELQQQMNWRHRLGSSSRKNAFYPLVLAESLFSIPFSRSLPPYRTAISLWIIIVPVWLPRWWLLRLLRRGELKSSLQGFLLGYVIAPFISMNTLHPFLYKCKISFEMMQYKNRLKLSNHFFLN